MTPQTLSPKERARFNICKEQITTGLETFYDTGMALKAIRDEKLYREEFGTFVEFCQQTYQIAKTHAYRLIESAEIKMSPIGDKIQNEAQARAIAKVPEEDRKAVLKIAEKSGALTAAAISVAAEQIEEVKPAPKAVTKAEPVEAVQLDKALSRPIPAKVLPLWNRAAEEGADILCLLSSIRCALRKAQEDDDRAFAELNLSGSIAKLDAVYSDTKSIAPYAVCTTCQGLTPTKCTFCKGRGFISEFYWKTHVPKETKELIARGLKK